MKVYNEKGDELLTEKELLERFKERGFALYKVEEKRHEVGNWYGRKNDSGCIYMTNESSEHFDAYGVAGGSWYYNSDHWLKSSWNIKLTPEQAYERLKKWFIENGYKEGVRVKCANDEHIKTIKEFMFHEEEIRLGGFCINITNNSPGAYVWLMDKGKLAEIVEDNNIEVGDYVKVVDDDLIVFGIVLHTDYEHEYQKVSLKGCGWLPGKPTKITKEKYEQVKNM